MAELIVRVCDMCKSQEDVKRYEVKEGVRKARIDLCNDHGEPVEEILKRATSGAQGGRATRTRARKVTTMDEIEALKKS